MGRARSLLVGIVAGCTPRPAALMVSPDPVRVAEEPVALRAVVVDAGGVSLDVPVTWTTSDPAVATVDHAGRLTAVRSGTTTVRASAGERYDDVLVEVELFASATLEVPLLLTAGERAPLSWSARDDTGGPWEGAVACSSADGAVLAVADGEVVALTPGRSTVTCVASGRTFAAEVHVLPSAWDTFVWRRATSVKVGERVVAPFSSDEVPSDDWVRLTEAFSWRSDDGRPAYVVLAELLDLTVAYTTHRGQLLVMTHGERGLDVGTRIDLGARWAGVPLCEGCALQRGDNLAPPRFTATGLVVGGVGYGWQDGVLVQRP